AKGGRHEYASQSSRQRQPLEQFGRLWQDFHSWEANVMTAPSRLGASETDISHFKTLMTFRPRRLPALNDASRRSREKDKMGLRSVGRRSREVLLGKPL